MELEQTLNEYRNGDENKRLCLFLTYREFRDEFSGIEEEKSVTESPIMWSPNFIHGDMIERLATFLGKGFKRSRSCCFSSAGVGRTG